MRTRDYQTVADIIRKVPKARGQRNAIAQLFSEEFKKQRTNFKEELFLKACGYSEQQAEEE